MTISIDLDALQSVELSGVCFRQEHSISQPIAKVQGVSYSGPPRTKLAVATGLMIFSITTGSTSSNSPIQVSAAIICPVERIPNTDLAKQYSRLREGIVEAGIPLLDDESVLKEIQDRKGVRFDQEA